MKRIVSLLLVLVMAFTSVAAAATALDVYEGGRFESQPASGFADIAEFPGISFEYTQGENAVTGGILRDAQGMPVIEGSLTDSGETMGARISREGLVALMPDGAKGLTWDTQLALALKEIGLDGMMDLRSEDAMLIIGMLSEITSGISSEALSVRVEEIPGAQGTKKKITYTADAGLLAKELDAAVCTAMGVHFAQMDEMLARWDKLIRQLGFDSGLTAADVLTVWSDLGLSKLPLTGIKAELSLIHSGSIDRPWEMRFSTLGVKAALWFDNDGLHLEIAPLVGSKLVFDSRDAVDVFECLLSAFNAVTPEAFDFSNEISDGMHRITLNIDPDRLTKQLIAGLGAALSGNRAELDALIDKYRPWLMLIDPEEAELFNTDSLMKLFATWQARYRYRYSYRYGYASNPVYLNICIPARDLGVYAGEAVAAGFSAEPVEFEFDSGNIKASFKMGKTHLAASYSSYYTNRNISLKAHTDLEGKALTATLTSAGIYNNRIYGILTLEVDETGLSMHTDDFNVRVTFTETGADISGMYDDDPITGTIIASEGLWKLTLSDGYDTLNAMLRAGNDSFALTADVDGEAVSIEGSFAGNRFDLALSAGYVQASLSAENTGYGPSVEIMFSNGKFYNKSNVRIEYDGLRFHVIQQSGKNPKLNCDLEVNLNLYGQDPRLDISLKDHWRGEFDLCLRRDYAMLLTPRLLATVEEVESEAAMNARTIRVSLYDSSYAYREIAGQMPDENGCVRFDLTMKKLGDVLQFTLTGMDGEICMLSVDFDPEAAEPLPEDTMWIDADRYMLMRGADIIGTGSTAEEDKELTAGDIRYIQGLLERAGFKTEGAASGEYDAVTRQAVSDFQNWINEMRMQPTLPANGEADRATVIYLEYCAENWIEKNAA